MARANAWMIGVFSIGLGCGSSTHPIAGGKTVEHWLEKLECTEVPIRVEAIKKLGNIGAKDPLALPAIYEALDDSAPKVRREAIYALVRNWPASREALSHLERIKDEDMDSSLRKVAGEALRNLISRK